MHPSSARATTPTPMRAIILFFEVISICPEFVFIMFINWIQNYKINLNGQKKSCE